MQGRVTDFNADPKNGSITLEIDGQERTFPAADVVLREDLAPPPGVADAYEGHGGEHEYLAYRVLRPWEAESAGWQYCRNIPETGADSRQALLAALRTAEAAARVQAAEAVLQAALSPADVGLVMQLHPEDETQVAEAAQAVLRWRPDGFASTAETNTGMVLLLSEKNVVQDPYRGTEWTAGRRETVGFKSCELAAETLQSWFDRPESNYGVALQRKGGAGGSFLHRFAASENPVAAHRPRLALTYRVRGEEQPRELVLQNGLNNYHGATEAVIASDVETPMPRGPEFLLGASARRPAGGLALDWLSSTGMLANWVFVLTLICVMTYFLFSLEHNRPGIYQASVAGRWLMMLCFGAFFGSTIMARMALLVERLQFLIEKWIPTLLGR